MEKKMLINAVHPEECRIAIIEGANLLELEIESNIGRKQKGNIYKARIGRLEPSLQAAFLDIGAERNGFLQINDIHPAYFKKVNGNDYSRRRPLIQDVLEVGQELVVQVVKDERELKGATLTTYLTLPGRYVVLLPGSERAGISRKISDVEQRRRLKALARELEIPAGLGVIIRTAGLDRSHTELTRDLELQLKVWERIVTEAQEESELPRLLYEDSDLPTRVIRDYFTPDIREILIDHEDTYIRVKEFIERVMPRYRSRVKLYDSAQPIFTAFGIDDQVSATLRPEVRLPSGGSIVIESLEALTAIDVNSSKATAGEDIEDTAFKTNLEAVEEIAKQLRLRDLGGLIVVDFIDMLSREHRSQVERKMREAVRLDKARVEIGHISRFGLLEMSRQRLRAPLTSHSHLKCAMCGGSGKIKNPEFVALEVLRKIQSAAAVGQVSTIKARLSPQAALFLLNNKKRQLAKLEIEYGMRILILPDGSLKPDNYQFEIETRREEREALKKEIEEDDTRRYDSEVAEIDEKEIAEGEIIQEEAEEEKADKEDSVKEKDGDQIKNTEEQEEAERSVV
ncbi:MAG: Rne/Rng family ribonuclease [Candidatus Dadabacteria bacterium]|nr:MAG: Rne/Rng family ribonuclease [Candidatus Dadabacteria bacterium]